MNKREQRELLDFYLAEYRQRPYQHLLRFADPKQGDHYVVPRESGDEAYVDVQGIWDDQGRGHLRILVSVYDKNVSAFIPATDDFIIAPDGSFVGEG
jgi:hypothetical protein